MTGRLQARRQARTERQTFPGPSDQHLRSRDLHVREPSEIISEINNSLSEEVLMPIPLTSNKPNTRRSPPADLQEQIRSRAYELYEQRNRTEGRDLDDWLQAEAELTGTKNSATT